MAIFGKKNIQTDAQFDILPKNIGIIMDGNGRWAKKRALPRSAGHKAGAEVFRTISKECGRLGLESATFYAFSTENWKRPEEEVNGLMNILVIYINSQLKRILENNIVFRVIGDYSTAAGNMKMKFIGEREGMSKELLDLMDEAEEDTSNNTGTTIYLAVNYGGRLEICDAVNKLVAMGKTNITEKDISDNIFTPPECDLIIRPSGEQRLSNFMLWQSAYSELWYSDVLWPDFKIEDLHMALRDFEKRNRRFGG